MKKSNTLSLVISGFFFLIIAAGCSTKSVEKAAVSMILDQTVKSLNKDCPKMIDKDVRIDKVLTPSDSVLQYNYTLVNYAIADLDTAAFKSRIEPSLISVMQTDSDMKIFGDYNVTVAYQYSDKDGKLITKVTIPPSVYKK